MEGGGRGFNALWAKELPKTEKLFNLNDVFTDDRIEVSADAEYNIENNTENV